METIHLYPSSADNASEEAFGKALWALYKIKKVLDNEKLKDEQRVKQIRDIIIKVS